jgi:hypothetical protein
MPGPLMLNRFIFMVGFGGEDAACNLGSASPPFSFSAFSTLTLCSSALYFFV